MKEFLLIVILKDFPLAPARESHKLQRVMPLIFTIDGLGLLLRRLHSYPLLDPAKSD